VSTVSSDNTPYGSAVFFTVDSDFNFYFFTKDDSAKFNNMGGYNQVAIVVYNEAEPQIIQAKGEAILVDAQTPKASEVSAELFRKAVASSPWYQPPITKMTGGEVSMVKIKTTWLRYADFRKTTSHRGEALFYQIIP
jgi:nitroimidazol reductase NimA-like FMN-containing flavoprotein (pyridoxamine 5'-phosphate oxidase superfamily)